MRQTLLSLFTEPEMSAGGHSRPVIDISGSGRAWVGTANRFHADMNAHANPGCTTSPHAQEVGHHTQAAQLQERNGEDSAFTLVRILATHFKRSGLRSAGGLLSSQWNYTNTHFNLNHQNGGLFITKAYLLLQARKKGAIKKKKEFV